MPCQLLDSSLREPSALGTQADQLPTVNDWRYQQVCAGDVQAMISPHVAAMVETNGNCGRDPLPTGGRGTRESRKQSPSRATRERFAWDGSFWHRRVKDHNRDMCSAYKKLCDANGSKAPANYESAHHKARKASTAKHKATKDQKPAHHKNP